MEERKKKQREDANIRTKRYFAKKRAEKKAGISPPASPEMAALAMDLMQTTGGALRDALKVR